MSTRRSRALLYAVALGLSSLLFQLYLDKSINRRLPIPSARIDNEFYGTVDWWSDHSPMSILRKMNMARVPYFEKRMKRSGKVLDVGCGGGLVSEELADLGFDVVGIDGSEGAIEAAKEHAKGRRRSPGHNRAPTYLVGSAYDLPFPDASFDAVVVSDVLEHLLDLPAAVKEIHRVLKPKGVIVLDTINRSIYSVLVTWLIAQEILNVVPHQAHDWRLFIQPEELKDILASSNFQVDLDSWVGLGEQLDFTKVWTHKSLTKGITGFTEVSSKAGSYMGWAVKL